MTGDSGKAILASELSRTSSSSSRLHAFTQRAAVPTERRVSDLNWRRLVNGMDVIALVD